MRKYEVTVMANLQTGETAEHDIYADYAQLTAGNLCFFEEYDQPTWFPGISVVKAKLVQSYAAGIWTEFHEYEDDEMLVDAVELSPELEDKIKEAFRWAGNGKDGSVAGG